MTNNIEIEVNYIAEKDIDLLIIEEFTSNENFASIFLSKIGIFEFSVVKAFHSMVDVTYGESDITFVIKSLNQKIGILIEDKIDAIAMPQQYERYEKRAEKLLKQGLFSTYFVFIVAPKQYIESNFEASKYPYQVTYEELLKYILSRSEPRYRFKEVIIKNAIEKKKSGYTPIKDDAVTLFWQNYYDFKNEYFPNLKLNEIRGPRGANATWPWFDTDDKRIRIAHKSGKGFVDLTLDKLGNKLLEVKEFLENHIDSDMKIVKTGKSASIRLKVPTIDFKQEFSNFTNEMVECLKSVTRLDELVSNTELSSIYDSLNLD